MCVKRTRVKRTRVKWTRETDAWVGRFKTPTFIFYSECQPWTRGDGAFVYYKTTSNHKYNFDEADAKCEQYEGILAHAWSVEQYRYIINQFTEEDTPLRIGTGNLRDFLNNSKFPRFFQAHYLMGLGPNPQKILHDSGKQIRIPEGM